MDFINESTFQAELIRSCLSTDDNDPLIASVILKVTYDILPDGSTVLAEEQLAVRQEPEESDLGPLPMDTAPSKPAIDLFILGSVQILQGKPLTQTTVRLSVGDQIRELIVYGDRHWTLNEDKLVISQPEPFAVDRLPLSYAYAYGGHAKALDYQVPYPYNLEGKGYVLEESHAEGVALPNIEDPDALIQSWEDRPIPAGFAPVPLSSMFTVDRGIVFDSEKNEQLVKPDVFQSAHPKLIFQTLLAGTEIVLEGCSPDSPIAFRVPDLQAAVSVQLEENTYHPAGKVDTLCLMADERRFYLIHRTPFKYPFIPEQIRIARLKVERHGGS